MSSLGVCPRCRCCDVENQRDGSMLCIGHCDGDGVHEPETADEWREVVREKDATIHALRSRIYELEARR